MAEVEQFPLEEEYKKNTGVTPDDIKELRQWLKTQPHLPEKYITDLDLICSYYSCERSSGVTKQVIDLHYTLRTLFTQFFKNRTVESIEEICTAILITPLTQKTKDGDAVLYCSVIDTDPKAYCYTESVRAVFMIIDLWQYEEGTWPGFNLVLDFKGATLGHLARIDLHALHQFIYYVQETMSVKMKGLHLLNAPSWVDKVVSMLKLFMKKELLDLTNIHPVGSKDVDKYVPIAALPKDRGGNYKTAVECRDDLLNKLRANRAFFENENKKRVNESLRPGKPKTITDVFGGIEGSFKSLEID
ncbi:unnamed protein product [Leptosia nina]|uniref:CRAL-TRIO domain-containing protein n=1 Tax=Leptosia nina TaxID=320188 RepID=A0AAV1IYE2_9NEOP